MPKCKICKSSYEKKYVNQQWCSSECAVKLANIRLEKKDKAETRERKENARPKSYFEKLLEAEVNRIVREIDYMQRCVSCDGKIGKLFACHFRSVGGHPSIRYNLFNIYGGCFSCNGKKGGNVHGYDDGLIRLFGREFWEYCKFDLMKETPSLRLSIDELKEKIKTARGIKFSFEEPISQEKRLGIRKEVNESLGIYKRNKQ